MKKWQDIPAHKNSESTLSTSDFPEQEYKGHHPFDQVSSTEADVLHFQKL